MMWTALGCAAFAATPDLPSNVRPAPGAEVGLNPSLTVHVHDPDGDPMNVHFYGGPSESLITHIATVSNVPSASDCAVFWNDPRAQRTYAWYAVADDGTQQAQSPTWHFSVASRTGLTFAVFSDAAHGSDGVNDPLLLPSAFIGDLADDCGNHPSLPRLDFVCTVGDMLCDTPRAIDGAAPDYTRTFQEFIEALDVPFFAALGNHDVLAYDRDPALDWSDNPYRLMRRLLNELEIATPTYAVCVDNILLLFIGDLGTHYELHTTQYEWMEYMAERYHDLTTIILSHPGIWTTTYEVRVDGADDYSYYNNAPWWAEFLRGNPQIKAYIHGHSHAFDWTIQDTVGSEFYEQGEGLGSNTLYDIGHDMAFIQAPCEHLPEGDTHSIHQFLVINVSSNQIDWQPWRHDATDVGFWDDPGAHASPSYHAWQTPTSFDAQTASWYSFPLFFQDGELQSIDSKVISRDVALELVGVQSRELFANPDLDVYAAYKGVGYLGLHGESLVQIDDGIMRETGPKVVEFPERYRGERPWDGGDSGQIKNWLFCGACPQLVPGAAYDIEIEARAAVPASLSVMCKATDWSARSQYSFLAEGQTTVISATVGTSWTTLSGTYVAPSSTNAWFLCGEIHFADAANYQVSRLSIKRQRSSEVTEAFQLTLNGVTYGTTGALPNHVWTSFPVAVGDVADTDGVMRFRASVAGNRTGMARVIYPNPVFGRGARIRPESFDPLSSSFDVTVVEDISSDYSRDLTTKILPLTHNRYFSTDGLPTVETGNGRMFAGADIDMETAFVLYDGYRPAVISELSGMLTRDAFEATLTNLVTGNEYWLQTATSLVHAAWHTQTNFIATHSGADIPVPVPGEKVFFRVLSRP